MQQSRKWNILQQIGPEYVGAHAYVSLLNVSSQQVWSHMNKNVFLTSFNMQMYVGSPRSRDEKPIFFRVSMEISSIIDYFLSGQSHKNECSFTEQMWIRTMDNA